MDTFTPIQNLRLDLSANKGNWRGKIVLTLFRLSQVLRGKKNRASFFRRFFLFLVLFFEWLLGCEISPKARIGPRFVIYHPAGIVIGPNAQIGANFVIRQNCTVGQRVMKGDAPQIGDYVEMGANSLILGAIFVGNNVKLGANSMLISDAREPGTYVGSPARRLLGCPDQID